MIGIIIIIINDDLHEPAIAIAIGPVELWAERGRGATATMMMMNPFISSSTSINSYKTWPYFLYRCLFLISVGRIHAAFFTQPTTPAYLSSHRRLSRQFSIEARDDDARNPHDVPQLPTATSSAFEDALFLERFKRRRDEASSKIEAERLQRPPSNSTHFSDSKNVVTAILDGLLRPHDPVPYFGYEILYTSSTPHWKDVLRKSVGAPIGTEEELIFRALSTSM